MPDPRFFTASSPLSVEEAAEIAGKADPETRLASDQSGMISRAASPDEDDLQGAIIFCERKVALDGLAGRGFGLCVASEAFADQLASSGPVLVSSAARYIFAHIAEKLHAPVRDDGAPLTGEGAQIHPTAVVAGGAEIGPGAVIGPYGVIGPGVIIGEGTEIASHVTVEFAFVGARCRILSGVRIGQAGFGFAQGPRGLVRVPQLGRVIIGDDVEIGANSTVDRGALGDTTIGSGARIDNLVHVAHNVQIGRNCIIAGQVGFSGSVEMGEGVLVGGQAGFADHVRIGDGARIAAQAGLIRDVPAGESWGGTPAMPQKLWLRAATLAMQQAKGKRKKNDH